MPSSKNMIEVQMNKLILNREGALNQRSRMEVNMRRILSIIKSNSVELTITTNRNAT